VTWGTAKGDSSPIPLVSDYHDASQEQRKRNLGEARRLLAQAGYRGQAISFVTNRRYPQYFDAAVLVQAMAAEAGINLQIEILDWASQVDAYAAGKYQTMLFSFSAKSDPSLSFGMLIGDKAKEPRKVWDSPWAIATLKKSAEAADPAARRALFDDLNRAFMRDVPAVILYSSTRIAAVRRNVVGYRIWPAAQSRLWNVGFARGS
jgi:peptide/nickel transport system substrate-binding protein